MPVDSGQTVQWPRGNDMHGRSWSSVWTEPIEQAEGRACSGSESLGREWPVLGIMEL